MMHENNDDAIRKYGEATNEQTSYTVIALTYASRLTYLLSL